MLKTSKVRIFLLALVTMCITSFAPMASAQTSGYVPIVFGQNPSYAGQNVVVETNATLVSCISANYATAGTIRYYVSTTESGVGTYLGTGASTVFNSIEEGNQASNATYYFYGYYVTSGTVNGVPDPCYNVVTLGTSPEWGALSIEG